MNIIEQLIQEKHEAVDKTIRTFMALQAEATSSNLYAMRSNLIERAKVAENLLIKQEEITDEACALLEDVEEDNTISEAAFIRIEDAAYQADTELFHRQNICDAYKEAIELLDKLDNIFRYIEAQEN